MTRVVIAGLGDTGVLTAIKLARHAQVTGICSKPGLVSGQELGWRLARPDEWARHNWIPYGRFRGLDRVITVHGTLTGVDLESRCVSVQAADGTAQQVPYDALVIATGVRNGFWRTPVLQGADEVDADLRAPHEKLAAARSVRRSMNARADFVDGVWPGTSSSTTWMRAPRARSVRAPARAALIIFLGVRCA